MAEDSNNVRMVAICTARPDCVNDVRAILEMFVEASAEEPGCLSYMLHTNLDDPVQFVFYEVWKDQSAVDRHFNFPRIRELIERLQPLLVEPAKLLRLKALL